MSASSPVDPDSWSAIDYDNQLTQVYVERKREKSKSFFS